MAGWKEWAIGEVVEAGDIQGFIQNQTVMVFDTDTARDTALSGVVIEGMMAYTKDSDLVKVYDGAAWIGLAEAPDLTTLIPKSTVTTAGDLIVADGASSVTRIGVGTDDQVLTLVSGAPAWADAGGGGGMTLLVSGTVSGLTTVSLTSIPQTYQNLYFTATKTNTGNSSLKVSDNNTGNGYIFFGSLSSGTGSSTYSSGTLDQFGSFSMVISNYTATNSIKSGNFSTAQNTNPSGFGGAFVGRSTGAVSQLNITNENDASNITYALYGVN
jgi:hypothetical protein